MKLRVQRGDGSIETISLVGPAEIHHSKGTNLIRSASGMDHYFLPDGSYDGWGMALPSVSVEDAGEIIDRVNRERKIEPPRKSEAPGG